MHTHAWDVHQVLGTKYLRTYVHMYVHPRHTVHIVRTEHSLHTTYCTCCTMCMYCTYCTVHTVHAVHTTRSVHTVPYRTLAGILTSVTIIFTCNICIYILDFYVYVYMYLSLLKC